MSEASAPRPLIGYVDERFFLTDWARDALAELGELRRLDERSDLAGCHVLCAHFVRQLTAADLEAATDAALIVHPGSAILCDVEAASRLGILVVHFPGVNGVSVAEHTAALMLDLAKGITASDREVRSGVAWQPGERRLVRTELAGKVLGLVGFGRVAQQVARIASLGLGMEVQAWARRGDEVNAAGFRWRPDLDDLLRTSDLVSLHVALNSETRGLLDARRLGLLRPHALLVNTARAELVELSAMRSALTDGRLAGAAFDVWSGDRPSLDFPLLGLPNAILTQHNAGLTHEASGRAMQAVVACVRDVLDGRQPTAGGVVNPEVWERRRAVGLRH
jgi:D-3-phosphoglycerate dehydrogenase